MLSFSIPSLDEGLMEAARHYIDCLTKPPGSLGRLEDIAIQFAGITGQLKPDITPGIVVFAADHGVVAENVSASPQAVTHQMAINMVEGGAGISVFGQMIGASLDVYDVGILQDVSSEKVIKKKVREGTGNLAKECAMTEEQAWQTIEIGYEAAKLAIDRGVRCLIVGELGIDPQSVVGRGSGIDDQQLQRKIDVCREAIAHHQPNKNDAIDLLAKIGGLDIAAMTGAMIAAAERRVPILLDGFICTVSACLAKLLAPGCEQFMLVSHQSVEPGHIAATQLLGKKAIIGLDLRLGEGTGAAIAYPIVQAANVMVKNMATFERAKVSIK